jgi:5-methylcytosine-specific restriction endonuclease McrA
MPYDAAKRKAYHEKHKERKKDYYIDLKQCALDSITSGEIINRHKWDLWCNKIKSNATNKKHPYSVDFTNVIIFDMMKKGCFYCGDISTTIDRIDSTLIHTPDNCVGCCYGCNTSKGASDPSTFIRKAYFRARGRYVDDNANIWFINAKKPVMWDYKKRSEKQGVPFELDKEVFDMLIKGDCKYCKRSPITWFGIDRLVPSLGYVLGNVMSCCYDCNLDKLEDDIKSTNARNEKISTRVDTGELVIESCHQVILHKGTHKSSIKVCAYGNIYDSKRDASRALGKNDTYVGKCIKNGWHSNDIFEI